MTKRPFLLAVAAGFALAATFAAGAQTFSKGDLFLNIPNAPTVTDHDLQVDLSPVAGLLCANVALASSSPATNVLWVPRGSVPIGNAESEEIADTSEKGETGTLWLVRADWTLPRFPGDSEPQALVMPVQTAIRINHVGAGDEFESPEFHQAAALIASPSKANSDQAQDQPSSAWPEFIYFDEPLTIAASYAGIIESIRSAGPNASGPMEEMSVSMFGNRSDPFNGGPGFQPNAIGPEPSPYALLWFTALLAILFSRPLRRVFAS